MSAGRSAQLSASSNCSRLPVWFAAEVRGNQVYFQANQKAAIFPELQGLFAKTVGLVDILRESLMPLADRMRAAFVFGSAARGALHASSDVDLLVVNAVSFGDVITAIQGTEKRLGRDVNPAVFSEDEFRTKVQATATSSTCSFLTGIPSECAKRSRRAQPLSEWNTR